MKEVLGLGLAVAIAASPRPSAAQEPSLAEHFGFTGLEVVKIGDGAGPILAADMNGDGLADLLAVNNRKSRIEIQYQRQNPDPAAVDASDLRVNEFPEHWRFRREPVSVSHEVGALVAHDFDGDGLTDLIYTGSPSEVVFVRQERPGVFDVVRRHRVRDLLAHKDALAVADVVGDRRAELLAVADGVIKIWTIDGTSLQHQTDLAAGDDLLAFFLGDYDGNGRLDVAGVMPENEAPVRLWLASVEDGRAALGPQLRFEMPAIREFATVPLPNREGDRIAVIERAAKRLVLHRLARESVQEKGTRDAATHVFAFTDPGNRQRDVAIVDADGDGLLDLLATDTEASALVLHRQVPGKGLRRLDAAPTFAEVSALAAGNVDDDPEAEVFVMSEEEGVVGRSEVEGSDVGFPVPLPLPEGRTPVAMNLVRIEGGPHVAVVTKDGREYFLELLGVDGTARTVELGSASRSPDTILDLDADQDGRPDLLLLTRDKPMTMLHAAEDGTFTLLESRDMGQFGLVQAATSENTGVADINGDDAPELLVADRNFVRALRYDPRPGEGVSPGWQVVRQINADDPKAKLVALTVLGDRVVAADTANDRLVVFARESEGEDWRQVETINALGFDFSEIHAAPFSGDDRENILAVGDDGFAVVRLGGERFALEELAAWRPDNERQTEHELVVGEVNGDGFTDLLALDAGEQLLEIFTVSEAERLLFALGFKTFDSKIFTSGEPRVFEPSQGVIADFTGDGANDVALLAHDRVLLYPQMTERTAESH